MRIAAAVLMGVLAAWTALAVPSSLHYQGRLLDSGGVPVEGTVTIAVALYAQPSGGTPLYSEAVGGVPVQNGLYEFSFGTNGPAVLAVLRQPGVWLEVVVNGEPLAPRAPLASSPYAMLSAETERITSNTLFQAGVVISGAVLSGDGSGLTNLTVAPHVETDPVWRASTNALQAQVAGLTPLATHASATGGLWTAIGEKADQSSLVTASNALAADVAGEAAARAGADSALSNSLAAVSAAKLDAADHVAATNALWAGLAGEAATRAGDDATLSNQVAVLTTGKLDVAAFMETDPLWRASTNALQAQVAGLTPLATHASATGELWTAIGAKADQSSLATASNALAADVAGEAAARAGADSALSNSLAAVSAAKLDAADHVAATNALWTGLAGEAATRAGDDATLSNQVAVLTTGKLDVAAFVETDPLWRASTNALQAQVAGLTPLATHTSATGGLWTAIGAKADQSSLATASNALAADVAGEAAARAGADSALSNSLAAVSAAKLDAADHVAATNALWAGLAGEAATRAGDDATLSNQVAVLTTGKLDVAAFVETDPLWRASTNALQAQVAGLTPLATHASATGGLWTAIGEKADQSSLVTASNALAADVAGEAAARAGADSALSNSLAVVSAAKLDAADHVAATNALWAGLAGEAATRAGDDATLSNQVAVLTTGKLDAAAWDIADATTNYVRRTGDTMAGPLVVGVVTGGVYFGDGAGLSNLTATAYAETDPVWRNSTNALQSQLAGLTPLAVHVSATGDLWSAVGAKADQASLVAVSNALAINVADEAATRQTADLALGDSVAAVDAAKVDVVLFASATNALGGEIADEAQSRAAADAAIAGAVAGLATGKLDLALWTDADATTNYVRRTGDSMTGPLVVGVVTGGVYYGDGAGLSNVTAAAFAETDPLWASSTNALQGQLALLTPLATHADATGALWTAVDARALLSTFAAATNALWASDATEASLRAAADSALSNSLTTSLNAKLSSNDWATAASTTNYLPRTGGTMTGTLAVNGTIQAREVLVTISGWPDYVFEKGYPLMTLEEVQAFITAHGHLPGMPSAQAVSQSGVSLGDMQVRLLEQVEALTLHVIRLEREQAELRQRLREAGIEREGNVP